MLLQVRQQGVYSRLHRYLLTEGLFVHKNSGGDSDTRFGVPYPECSVIKEGVPRAEKRDESTQYKRQTSVTFPCDQSRDWCIFGARLLGRLIN